VPIPPGAELWTGLWRKPETTYLQAGYAGRDKEGLEGSEIESLDAEVLRHRQFVVADPCADLSEVGPLVEGVSTGSVAELRIVFRDAIAVLHEGLRSNPKTSAAIRGAPGRGVK
jgi:hypothetical protein